MNNISYLGNAEPQVIEDYYLRYKQNPQSVDAYWQKFFEGFDFAQTNFATAEPTEKAAVNDQISKEAAVFKLIAEYRSRGHLFAKTNPIRPRRSYSPTITLDRFGLDPQDLNKSFQAGSSVGLDGPQKLSDIVAHLEKTYCGKIGCEFDYIRNPVMVKWLTDKMESTGNQPNFSRKIKLQIWQMLMKAVHFEQFLHRRFVGQKRFSLEGLEALIPAIETVIAYGAEQSIKEFVIGMAHRGRLNLLGNIFQKDYELIFSEFLGKSYKDSKFGGDVKYHMGASVDRMLENGKKVHLNIVANPSHLEAVNPVVNGVTRAKLDNRYHNDSKSIAPILIHGDASIAGQGVIYEQIQMSQLDSYAAGGTIHIVTNNQIGFTTNYIEGRSSTYCTDICKTVLSPAFHVNADDIEMVVFSVLLALDFRQTFQKDVFIDILGYRRYGHNEGDDPSLTQPKLYQIISDHPNPYQIYSEKLIQEKMLDEQEAEKMTADFVNQLDEKLQLSKQRVDLPTSSYLQGDWKGITLPESVKEVLQTPNTGVSEKKILAITKALTKLPAGENFSPKIIKMQKNRWHKINDEKMVDWAMGETLALGTLLDEGFNLRFSGEDSLRGTFAHRHAMLRTETENVDYYPLRHISPKQGRCMIYNSILSEYAVLGFEYGYSLAAPQTLTLWEAQFGDFANGAQIIIDQFLASGETKWQRMSGLILLLPHGFEGQGPEHSSARIERYLQLSAEQNMTVAMLTSPANLFHIIRRQMHRSFRKPLILFTPKAALRHPLCQSPLSEIGAGTCFHNFLDDPTATKKTVKKLLLCSGHIYFDLLQHQKKLQENRIALLRLEQLYPFDQEKLEQIIATYPKNAKLVFVQEEPENQGMIDFLKRVWKNPIKPWEYVARPESSSTSTGFMQQHKEELTQILNRAFAID